MVAKRKTPEQIRDDITAAAIEVIGRVGIAGLTHRAVAVCADVSLSSTTYHFASRQDIIDAALTRLIDEERGRIAQGTHFIESLDRRDRPAVRAAVTALLQSIVSSDAGSRAYFRAQYELRLCAVDQPSMHERVRAWTADVEHLAAHCLEMLGADDPKMAARIMVAAVDGRRLMALTTGESAEEATATNGAALGWLTELAIQ